MLVDVKVNLMLGNITNKIKLNISHTALNTIYSMPVQKHTTIYGVVCSLHMFY